MNYQELTQTLSDPKLIKCLRTAKNNSEKAIQLYHEQNVYVGNFLSLISYFEMILSHRINSYMTSTYKPNWLIILSRPECVLDQQNTIHTFTTLAKTRNRLSKIDQLNNGNMANNLGFDFWVGIFQPKQHAKLNNLPINVFSYAPRTEKLLFQIHRNLNQCRKIRNEVIRLENVIFRKNSSTIDFGRVEAIIGKIVKLTRWLGVSPTIYDRQLLELKFQKQVIRKLIPKN
ncbi:MAG: hypothetical protein LBG64_01025 [Pseudomonadales bacterium]|jgi:hypothetical protein|nr:hypothetical protein [Pseudomonadales bacterium]